MGNNKKRLTLAMITAVSGEDKEEDSNILKELPKKMKLKDLEKFSKSVRFPILWRKEIEKKIDYPSDLSSFIVEAIKEKMERENMNTFIG